MTAPSSAHFVLRFPSLRPLLLPFGPHVLLCRPHVIQLGLDLRADLELSARRLRIVAAASEQEETAEPEPARRDNSDDDPPPVQRMPPSPVMTSHLLRGRNGRMGYGTQQVYQPPGDVTMATRKITQRVASRWLLPGRFPRSVVRGESPFFRRGSIWLAVDLLELADAVLAVDHADGARAGAHHDRLAGRALGEETNALDQGAVGDPGGGEEDVVALDQIVGGQDAIEVVPGLDGGLALLVVSGLESSLDHAAEAFEGRGGDHALGRPADAVEQVDARAAPGGRDGPGDVAVGQQIDPRTRSSGRARRSPRAGDGRGSSWSRR